MLAVKENLKLHIIISGSIKNSEMKIKMNEIEYDALEMSENEITREILHKMLYEMLTKIENGEEVNTARLGRAFLTDEGEIKIKEYKIKILLEERNYGY